MRTSPQRISTVYLKKGHLHRCRTFVHFARLPILCSCFFFSNKQLQRYLITTSRHICTDTTRLGLAEYGDTTQDRSETITPHRNQFLNCGRSWMRRWFCSPILLSAHSTCLRLWERVFNRWSHLSATSRHCDNAGAGWRVRKIATIWHCYRIH